MTVNGTYCLPPCALSKSCRAQVNDNSFGAGCPAARPSMACVIAVSSAFCAFVSFGGWFGWGF